MAVYTCVQLTPVQDQDDIRADVYTYLERLHKIANTAMEDYSMLDVLQAVSSDKPAD